MIAGLSLMSRKSFLCTRLSPVNKHTSNVLSTNQREAVDLGIFHAHMLVSSALTCQTGHYHHQPEAWSRRAGSCERDLLVHRIPSFLFILISLFRPCHIPHRQLPHPTLLRCLKLSPRVMWPHTTRPTTFGSSWTMMSTISPSSRRSTREERRVRILLT